MNRPDWRALRRIGGPTKQELVLALREYRDDLRGYDPQDLMGPGCEEPSGDVRLQVYPGSDSRTRPEYPFWNLHTGDSQYDHDHRGYWGACSVSPNSTIRELNYISEDLASQVLDMVAEDRDHA